jgi:hypothetical protein
MRSQMRTKLNALKQWKKQGALSVSCLLATDTYDLRCPSYTSTVEHAEALAAASIEHAEALAEALETKEEYEALLKAELAAVSATSAERAKLIEAKDAKYANAIQRLKQKALEHVAALEAALAAASRS